MGSNGTWGLVWALTFSSFLFRCLALPFCDGWGAHLCGAPKFVGALSPSLNTPTCESGPDQNLIDVVVVITYVYYCYFIITTTIVTTTKSASQRVIFN